MAIIWNETWPCLDIITAYSLSDQCNILPINQNIDDRLFVELHAKGQLISKCHFWCLLFSQKTNENNSTWGTIVVKLIFFCSFLGELKIPKRHFEINWPLGSIHVRRPAEKTTSSRFFAENMWSCQNYSTWFFWKMM